jgi:hypothetical protein
MNPQANTDPVGLFAAINVVSRGHAVMCGTCKASFVRANGEIRDFNSDDRGRTPGAFEIQRLSVEAL